MDASAASSPTRIFSDRFEAGRALAEMLRSYANRPDAIVLALPRGGVPVGYEIAKALNLPLDIFVVKKITVPGYDEMALGAVASEGVYLLDEALLDQLGLNRHQVEQIASTAYREVQRREQAYRHRRPAPELEGRAPSSSLMMVWRPGPACKPPSRHCVVRNPRESSSPYR